MPIGRSSRFLILVGLAGLGTATGQAPSPPDPQTPKHGGDEGHWKEVASSYQIVAGADLSRRLTLHDEPVLRWNNPIRKASDGSVFVWTDRGRPEVVAALYRYGDEAAPSEDHEFMSTSLGPLEALRGGVAVWAPTTPGVVSEPIPGAPVPAADAAGRLRQMRALARDFRAFFNNPPDRSEIRLLTQPLYRYEIAEPRPDLLDGSLFAFVHTTDPEVLLLIEARPTGPDKAMRWHFSTARMSLVNLRMEHRGREVWSASWDSDLKVRSKPYTALTIPASG